MSKSSVRERLKMFIRLVPLVVLLIFFDLRNYPLLNIALIFFSAMGAMEMNNLLDKSFSLSVSPSFACFLGAFPVALTFFLCMMGWGEYLSEAFLMAFIFLSFLVSLSLLSNQDISIEKLLSRVLLIGCLFFYPSLSITYGTRITFLHDSKVYVLLLCFIVFANDSLAYAFGYIFGKWIPGGLRVSPHKTIMGFLGGGLGSVLSMVGAWYFEALHFDLLMAILTGAFLGFSVIWGDLLESAFKRRAGVKDSGTLIHGRGGVLDSFDSFFFVTPALYYCIILFG